MFNFSQSRSEKFVPGTENFKQDTMIHNTVNDTVIYELKRKGPRRFSQIYTHGLSSSNPDECYDAYSGGNAENQRATETMRTYSYVPWAFSKLHSHKSRTKLSPADLRDATLKPVKWLLTFLPRQPLLICKNPSRFEIRIRNYFIVLHRGSCRRPRY